MNFGRNYKDQDKERKKEAMGFRTNYKEKGIGGKGKKKKVIPGIYGFGTNARVRINILFLIYIYIYLKRDTPRGGKIKTIHWVGGGSKRIH